MGNSNMKKRKQVQRQKKTLRLWMIVTFGGLFLLTSAFLLLRGNQNQNPTAPILVKGAPGLKVDKEKVDLGDIKLGQTVKVEFKLTNVGDQPLRFSQDPYVEVVEGC